MIDVTSLGSYVFCARAGVLSYKQQGLDSGNVEKPRVPNLSYVPAFTEDELKEEFDRIFPAFLRYSLSCLIGFLLLWVIAAFFSVSLSLLLLLPGSLLAWKATTDGLSLLAVLAELSRHKDATPSQLDSTATGPVEVSWYGLIKDGYISFKPKGRYEDLSLNLCGQPWRILQTTNADRIPVFNYSGSNFVIRDSQIMRLALYSHLCKKEFRGSKSEWGILLDVATKRCFAIPIDDHLRSKAIKELKRFSRVLDEDQNGQPVKTPAGSPCENCLFGKPRPFISGVSDTRFTTGPIGANTHSGHHGQPVHSDCGDKFDWRPHHRYWHENS
ncbi:hypothetical protein [Novipirellula rosea]|uniref:hypothetical protein n=1 Tax=Novipirellula rosea TaxID=1031540 RepID=UPI0031E961BC|tara:strand:- start:63 stop:1046 length:984 start_codon:yes stop_codon:yes gene_type:complete